MQGLKLKANFATVIRSNTVQEFLLDFPVETAREN